MEELSGRDVLLPILMAVAVLLVVGFFFAPIGCCGGYGIMSYMPMMGYGMYFIIFLIPLLFIVILVIGAYYVFRAPSRTQERDRALDIIKERYARGEITEEQYRKMKEELK